MHRGIKISERSPKLVIAKMAAASRTANKNQQKSTSKTSNSSDAFVDWQKHSFAFIQSMIDKVDTEVRFNPRG